MTNYLFPTQSRTLMKMSNYNGFTRKQFIAFNNDVVNYKLEAIIVDSEQNLENWISIITLILPGEVKADLVDIDMKLRENLFHN